MQASSARAAEPWRASGRFNALAPFMLMARPSSQRDFEQAPSGTGAFPSKQGKGTRKLNGETGRLIGLIRTVYQVSRERPGAALAFPACWKRIP